MSRIICDVVSVARWYELAGAVLALVLVAYGFVRLHYGHMDGLIPLVLGAVILGCISVLYRAVVEADLAMIRTIQRMDDTAQ